MPAKSKFDHLANHKFESNSSDFNAGPATSNSRISVRSNEHLCCIAADKVECGKTENKYDYYQQSIVSAKCDAPGTACFCSDSIPEPVLNTTPTGCFLRHKEHTGHMYCRRKRGIAN